METCDCDLTAGIIGLIAHGCDGTKKLTSFLTTSSQNKTTSDLEEHSEGELNVSTQQGDLVLDNSTDYTECG